MATSRRASSHGTGRAQPTNRAAAAARLQRQPRLDDEGRLYLIDEVLTPDSSRFWPVEEYEVGISPPSFDKQIVRDWTKASGWNGEPPAPALPDDVANLFVCLSAKGLRPDLEVTLLEPRSRRWAFLREAVRRVEGCSVSVERGRHDDYAGPPARTVTLRALALPLSALVPLVEPGGRVVSFGGRPRLEGPYEVEEAPEGTDLRVFRRRTG